MVFGTTSKSTKLKPILGTIVVGMPSVLAYAIDIQSRLVRQLQSLIHQFALKSPRTSRAIWVSPPFSEAHSLRSPSGVRKRQMKDLARQYENANNLYIVGEYWKSATMRSDTLAEVYEILGIDPASHWPRFLSPWYTKYFGHLGNLALLYQAEHIGLIPALEREVFTSEIANEEVFNALRHKINVIRKPKPLFYPMAQEMATPTFWADFERLETVKTREGFMDQYVLIERVQSEYWSMKPPESTFQFSHEKLEATHRQLLGIGVSPDEPFVALHIRENSNPDDPRLPATGSYLDSIRFLIKNGYKVLRFGAKQGLRLPEIPGLFDLVDLLPGDNSADGFVIANAAFLVTTVSGPGLVAMTMGTPTLFTNTPAIGRQTLSGPPGTRYLPKKVVGNSGEAYSLSQILDSPIGFRDGMWGTPGEWPKLISNSDHEILAAVEEMVAAHEKGYSNEKVQQMELESIRRQHGSVAFGKICDSFLTNNPKWVS